MTNDLKLSGGSNSTADFDSPTAPVEKKSGCGCFMVGCLILVALIVLPIVGGGIYIATLDDAEWGAKIVSVMRNPDFSEGFKKGISESDDISAQQRKALAALYDKFLADYDKLSPQQQETINKNIFAVIRKLFTDPKSFDKEPPKELMEIISTLKLESSFQNLKQSITDPQTTTTTTTTTTTQPTSTTTSDPYSFDIKDTTTKTKIEDDKTKPTSPPSTTTQPTYKTEYDF